jgi:hypothetical protein
MANKLTVKSVEFFKSVSQVNGQPIFSGKYTELHFEKYPVTTEMPAIAINCHAAGKFDALYSIRARLGDQIIFESAPSLIHGRDAGGGGDIGFIGNIKAITFPGTGLYMFDIIFDGQVIHSEPLILN